MLNYSCSSNSACASNHCYAAPLGKCHCKAWSEVGQGGCEKGNFENELGDILKKDYKCIADKPNILGKYTYIYTLIIAFI